MQLRSDSFADFLHAFESLDDAAKQEAIALAEAECGDMLFVPNPGPQEMAYKSKADVLFFGGAAAGGKTSLLCGLAVNEHYDIQIFRRESTQLRGLIKELTRIIGNTDGLNQSPPPVWKLPGDKTIELAGVKNEADKENWQGRQADYKGFDEITHFTRSQFEFIIGWNRTTRPNQRCRVVATGNPPMSAEALWVIQYWAAWLDDTHPDPAAPGELRWPVRMSDDDADEREIFFRDSAAAIAHMKTLRTAPRDLDGNVIPPRSRSFIPAALEDNPDLMKAGYAAVIESMPAHLREAMKGSFASSLRDQDFQVIPTEWIKQAQDRWTPDGWKEFTQTVMAYDPADGGDDPAGLIWRHGPWFARPVLNRGAITADGSASVATIVEHRRESIPVVVDCGGGYGGKVVQRLDDNSIGYEAFKGAMATGSKTDDKAKLSFVNKRAEALWRVREALDPDREGGSFIALPPDPEIRSDLAAPTYKMTQRGIQVESKEDLRKRLGRSTTYADIISMCWASGQEVVTRGVRGGQKRRHNRPTQQQTGYSDFKRKFRKRR